MFNRTILPTGYFWSGLPDFQGRSPAGLLAEFQEFSTLLISIHQILSINNDVNLFLILGKEGSDISIESSKNKRNQDGNNDTHIPVVSENS